VRIRATDPEGRVSLRDGFRDAVERDAGVPSRVAVAEDRDDGEAEGEAPELPLRASEPAPRLGGLATVCREFS
jgi:hypothetical protein